MTYLLLLLGLVLLIVGADGLVKGASRLASKMGIPSLVIGLTVVAFGTSAPELAVSINSALTGKTELAMANVVGSNIFNVLFILGLSAIVTPLLISKQLIRQDVPIMVAISALVYFLVHDGVLSRMDGMILVAILLGYTLFLFVQGKQGNDASEVDNDNPDQYPVWQSVLWLVVGLGMLIVGANLLVSSATSIARSFGVSDAVIGLTIIAIGTSLPEVMTSIVASFKGQRDIAVGNVVGSNIFNLLAVLGISSLFSTQGLVGNAQLVEQDFVILLGVAVLCLPLMFTDAVLSRIEGVIFFGLYVLYTAILIGLAQNASWAMSVQTFTLYGVLPIVGIFVVVSVLRSSSQLIKS